MDVYVDEDGVEIDEEYKDGEEVFFDAAGLDVGFSDGIGESMIFDMSSIDEEVLGVSIAGVVAGGSSVA